MITQYCLKMPERVYCGEKSMAQLENILAGCRKTVIFTDKGIEAAGLLEYPLEYIKRACQEIKILDELPSEPDYQAVQRIVDSFREAEADIIIAIGGGSVLDTAKLASIAATDDYSIKDLLEKPLLGKKQIRTVLIPTTAGTGSEATPNGIVAVPEKEVKVGIVNPEMMADYVILDGVMIKKLPLKIAAATGIDALAHALECYTSNKANPFSNLFALEALRLIFENIEDACLNPDAMEAKNKMLLAAFYGGVAITASGTTAVHALSYPLGGKYHIAHGISNAILLMPVFRFNKDACVEELTQIYDAAGFGDVQIEKEGKADCVLQKIEGILRKLQIPSSLKEFHVDRNDLDILVEAGMQVTRLLDNNKKSMTAEDARRIYLEVL